MTASGTGPGSQLGACALRITRVASATTGAPDYGSDVGAFVMCGGLSKVAFDFDVQKGQDIYEEDSCGNAVVIKRRKDRTKASTFTITMAKDDDRLKEISGVAVALLTDGIITGHAIQAAVGCDPTADPAGCIIEWWTEQVVCDKPHETAPWRQHMLPWAFLTPKGHEWANKTALPIYDGFAQVNPSLEDGPFSDWPSLVGVDNIIYAEQDATELPTCDSPLDYVTVPADS